MSFRRRYELVHHRPLITAKMYADNAVKSVSEMNGFGFVKRDLEPNGRGTVRFGADGGMNVFIKVDRPAYQLLVEAAGPVLTDVDLAIVERFLEELAHNLKLDTAARVQLREGLLGEQGGTVAMMSNAEANQQLLSIGQAVADLLAVVHRQQEEIGRLHDELERVTIARVQMELSDKASRHVREALLESVGALREFGNENGEVSIGRVRHEGEIILKEQTSQSESGETARAGGKREDRRRAIKAEISGIGKHLVGCGLGIDVRDAVEESSSEAGSMSRSERSKTSYVGTFAIEYDGVTLKVGK